MTALFEGRPGLKRWLLWGIPALALAVVIGVEWYRDRDTSDAVPPPDVRAPAPIVVGLLPAYGIAGGPDALQAIGEHTLFNPTRKPAPPAEATATTRSRLERGQFVLTGTQVFGDKAVAYLKSVKDGKPRTVRLGDTLDGGMRVASITPSGVRLAVDQESEELTLKVAAGPKSTIQPATEAAPAPQPGQPLIPPGMAVAQPSPQPMNAGVGVNTPPQSLAERRRAARAAQQPGSTAGGSTGASSGTATTTRGTNSPSSRTRQR